MMQDDEQILELPVEIEHLIWERVHNDVRKRLKARTWKHVHDELKGVWRFNGAVHYFVIATNAQYLPPGRLLIQMPEITRESFQREDFQSILQLLE
jgi:hypothetical protein